MLDQAAQPPAATFRLLYVEDDRVAALLFAQALRNQAGLDLQVAEDGAQAMALARQWLPQLLVLDAHLPDTNGHLLLAQLRCLPGLAGVPAYMCSADGGAQAVARALAAGFCGHWTKPVAAHTLRLAVKRLQSSPH